MGFALLETCFHGATTPQNGAAEGSCVPTVL
jgi:hypothetical protein